ncbi:thioester reductase domain-containing protein [Nocardia arthritidis]|uniref:thioester reductase domain-containing protein n=1 Tax=Nocardia arthritidis TaxID=228602 RepID=UPI0007A3A71D|nr:thioester reductase domain-containing protein [Nocardia arthritidis]
MSGIDLDSFATTLRAEDPVVRDHRVHGVRILPGVVYLDMILRAAMAAGYRPGDLTIREALFQRPVALGDDGAVRIAFRVDRPTGRIAIDVQRLDAAGLPAGPSEPVAECVVLLADSAVEPPGIDVAGFRASAQARGMAEMYAQSGSRGIEHRDFMRATGHFDRRDDLVTATLGLGPEAAAHLPGFLLHPTFLDASTIVPFIDPHRLGVDDDSAFIPIYFGDVRAWRATPEEVFVRATVRGGGHRGDLLEAEVAVYDRDGSPVVGYRLTSKRVRGSADIQRLLTQPESTFPPRQTASTHVPVASGDPRAVITADLAALIASELGADPAGIATDVGFYELGLDSGRLLRLTAELEARVGEPLYPTLLFEYQTIEALAGHLAGTVGTNYRPHDATAHPAPGTAFDEPIVTATESVADVRTAEPPTEAVTAVAPASVPAGSDELITFGFDWEPDATTHPRREPERLLVFDTAEHPYPHDAAATVIRVRPGIEFASGADAFVVDPENSQHMQLLVAQLTAQRLRFDAALYLWPEAATDPQTLIERVYLPLRDLLRAAAGVPQSPVRRVLAFTPATPAGESSCALLGGLARTLRLEQPQPLLRAVQRDPAEAIGDLVAAELGIDERDPDTEIRYHGGRRQVRRARSLTDPMPSSGEAVPRPGSVVVVTGGFGGIGQQLSRRLATDYGARLVLVSRRPLDAAAAGLLADLAGLGAEAVHVRADVSVAADAERVAAIAHATFGPVDVLYHGAGQLRDGLLSSTGRDDAQSVLAPKVYGVEHLTRALPEVRLTVLFSSVSAVLGNPGQADYAAANRYLDVFAEQRDRAGSRTISVGWPLWAEGGMRPPAEQIAALRRAGAGLLPTATGIDLLLSCATLDRAQLAALWGEPEALRARLQPAAASTAPAAETVSVEEHRAPAEEPIAIVGISGRYPDADDIEEFWRNLREGHDAVRPVPAERWWLTAVEGTPGAPPMIGGFVRDVGGFDPRFFRIPPVQAPLLDPQERLFLQQAYAALEHAGYHHTDPAVRARRVGVFVGATWSDYRLLGVAATRDGDPVAVASVPSSIANRTSYTLGLRGPSLTVDTACSASLTALHLARRSLLDGECDAAIVGGVNLLLHEDKFLLLHSLGMMSDSGRCRPFSAGADGYVPGEGVGALYLKPLSAARADGDTIHGLILGSAVNHGGQTSGYSVPHPGAQAEVIGEALRAAGVDPTAIDYLEAHGTGTPLGDPIEIAGLAAVFGRSGGSGRSRALGSAKSNVGHLEAAAGVAGLTRVLLQMRHGRIAPTPRAAQADPAIAFDSVPFHLPRELEDWPRRTVDGVAVARHAGISAFGAGGANAHVVLAEFVDDRIAPAGTGEPEIFVLSARTPQRLHRYAETMARHFRTLDPADFLDALRTLQVGRPALAHRLAVVASSPVEVADALDRFRTDRIGPVVTGTVDAQTQPLLAPATDDQELARRWVAGADIDWRGRGGPRRRIPLPGYPFERTDYWIIAPPRSGFDTAVRQFEAALQPTGIVEPGRAELGRYAAMLLFATLTGMGLTAGEWTAESLDARLGVRPGFGRLRTSCLDILRRHGLVRRHDDRFEVPGPPPGTSGMRADLLARFPETAPYVALLDACLAAYPRVLRGELSATEVLFPGGDLALVGAIYRGNAAYDFTNGLLAELVSAVGQRTGDTQPLRIVEIGAGTGGSTHAVLDALTARGIAFDYHYTDVSHSFLTHGRRAFGTRENLRFAVLDIDADPVAQGFSAHEADLVLCANVLHATRSIDATLRNIRRLLAPGGVLAFTEATTDLEVLALTFGLLEGWHGYRDSEARIPHSPLLSESQWQAALSAAGFSGIRSWGPGLSADEEPSFRLLAAVSATAPAAPAVAAPATTAQPSLAVTAEPAARAQLHPGVAAGPAPVTQRHFAAESAAAAQPRFAAAAEPAAVRQPEPSVAAQQLPAVSASAQPGNAAALEAELVAIVADGLGVARGEVRADLPLSEYGVDSILAVKIIDRVNARYGSALRPTVVFDHPSVRLLSAHLDGQGATAASASAAQMPARTSPVSNVAPSGARTVAARAAQSSERSASMDVAIVGMSGQFPGAANLEQFWRNLADGRDSVTEVPVTRWPIADYFRAGQVTPGKTYSKWGGFLDGVEEFDPAFFDLVPAEADYMDPQQRLFLEHSWLALEDAAIDPKSLRRTRCGVFAGSPGSDYANLLRNRGAAGSHHMFTGNSPAILPARVAYHLDLTGPCLGLDTACSSALVALHQACRSLASGESELALAGGVAVFVTPEYHLLASSMGMLSPRGRCASFDAGADGFVIAEGVGVVVLKPLAAAERDGDPIHGVIRGIGINHDGRTNGITAPSVRSQTELELAVYRDGGIDPSTIGYVETHGTGTRLGDPIEIEALTAAFRRYTGAVGAVAVGSVKSNIGHASHAAGMASLFKVLLAMRAGQLPPSLHVDSVNPLLGLDESPFFVNTELRAWNSAPRRAAISSFGFSGTNAHVVVDGAPEPVTARRDIPGGPQLVVLSARSATSLTRMARSLRRHLAAHPELAPADIARTLAFGRAGFEHRLAVVGDSVDALAARLAAFAEGDRAAGVFTGTIDTPSTDRAGAIVLDDPVAAARQWVEGGHVEHAGWIDPAARRIHLPGYEFDRERCWAPEVGGPSSSAYADEDRRFHDVSGPVSVSKPAVAADITGASEPAGAADQQPHGLVSPATEVSPLRQAAETYLKNLLAQYCRLDPQRIRTRVPLQDYGIDSVLISKMNDRLETDFGPLPSTLFFEYQTVRDLAGYLADEHSPRVAALTADAAAVTPSPAGAPGAARTVTPESAAAESAEPILDDAHDCEDIAVIGMAGKFPSASTVEEFWANLIAGRDCIVEVPPQRWDHREYLSEDPDEPGTTYARWGGFLDDVDKFDARFFGITPKDAEEMDPQQRLFLETSWAALEDAGYSPERVRRSAAARGLPDAGVFAGVGYAEYQAFVGVPISGYFAVANRVSYHFGFNGPSLAVDTACSASLTALHLACASLRRGEAAYALAGGVNVSIHPGKYLLLGYGRWASTDGRCRSFGAGGDGYVPGEGVVTLVLKPLRHARADGDRVYGVIRGSTLNHGGRTNGFTVPNPVAQADLIGRALDAARIDAGDIGYVEAHGTGTALGDPIEIAALTKAYRRSTSASGYCGIGSAKSSVGHLEAAAGAAGVVKALLQLRHDTIAPNLHSDPPNPGIDFAATPFRVIDRPTPWPRPADGKPRITAVSSFGAGGSNAHVILTDAEPVAPTPEDGQPRIVVLSARDADRLAELAARTADRLRDHPLSLPDVAWTLAVGRATFEHRLAVVATSTAELVELLDSTADSSAPAPAEGMLVFRGVARTHRDLDELPGESDAERAEVGALLRSGNLPRVAELWAGGWTVDWEEGSQRPFGRIVSLPGYPFARRRYWIVPEDYQRRTDPAPQVVAKTVVAWETEPPSAQRRNGHSTNGTAHQDIAVPAEPVQTPHESAATEPSGDEVDSALRDRLAEHIRDIFADLTKTDPADLDLDADFTDFGFDSVATVRMLNRLMKHYDVKIPAESTELYPTIASLSHYLVAEGIISGAAQDAPRPTTVSAATATQQDIPAITMDAPIPVRSVFITGVTGVLGGKLLHDLLTRTDARVTCLVRGKSVAVAEQRIKHFLATYDPDATLERAFAERVTTVLGDVSSERLGLDEDTWRQLADEVDLTIHAAGRTTLVTFYDALAPINVEGTRRAVDFALRSRGKYLVYVSSFSALGDRLNFNNPPFTERDLELGQGYDHLPYQQTKYESEKLIRAASERGLLWDIVRPGNIMGDSRTGRYPFSEVSVKGAYYDILKTMIETGETMLTPVHWDITPVDYVSAAIVHIALHRPTYRETYHLTNPDIRRYYDVVRYVQRAGYAVDLVPLEEFHRRATDRQIYRLGSDEVYDSQTLEMFKYGIELFGTIHYEESSYADCAYTRRVLGAAGIDCPPTEELVRVYLAHCAEVGYIPAPHGAQPAAQVLR